MVTVLPATLVRGQNFGKVGKMHAGRSLYKPDFELQRSLRYIKECNCIIQVRNTELIQLLEPGTVKVKTAVNGEDYNMSLYDALYTPRIV